MFRFLAVLVSCAVVVDSALAIPVGHGILQSPRFISSQDVIPQIESCALNPWAVGSRWSNISVKDLFKRLRSRIFRRVAPHPDEPFEFDRQSRRQRIVDTNYSIPTIHNDREFLDFVKHRSEELREGALTLPNVSRTVGDSHFENPYDYTETWQFVDWFRNHHPPQNSPAVFLGTDAEFLGTLYALVHPNDPLAVHRISRRAFLSMEEERTFAAHPEALGSEPVRESTEGTANRVITSVDNGLVYSSLSHLINASLRQAHDQHQLFEQCWVTSLKSEIEQKTFQRKRFTSRQIAYFGKRTDAIEAVLKQEIESGFFNQRVFTLFAAFYENVLSEADRASVYDIAAVGTQPLLLYGMLEYVKQLADSPNRETIIGALSPSTRQRIEHILDDPHLQKKHVEVVLYGPSHNTGDWEDVPTQDIKLTRSYDTRKSLMEVGKSFERRRDSTNDDPEPLYVPASTEERDEALSKLGATWQYLNLCQALENALDQVDLPLRIQIYRLLLATADNDASVLTLDFDLLEQRILGYDAHLRSDLVLPYVVNRFRTRPLIPAAHADEFEKAAAFLESIALPLKEEKNAIILPAAERGYYDPAFIRVRAFNPDFIQEERARSAEQDTIAVDFDGVVAHFTGEGHILNPTIVSQLEFLRRGNVRLVLWTGGPKQRLRYFFEAYPGMARFFDVVITGDDYMLRLWSRKYYGSLEEVQAAYPGHTQEDLTQYYTSVPGLLHDGHSLLKDPGLLGYRALIDDNAGIQHIGDKPLAEPFRVISVPTFDGQVRETPSSEPSETPWSSVAEKALHVIHNAHLRPHQIAIEKLLMDYMDADPGRASVRRNYVAAIWARAGEAERLAAAQSMDELNQGLTAAQDTEKKAIALETTWPAGPDPFRTMVYTFAIILKQAAVDGRVVLAPDLGDTANFSPADNGYTMTDLLVQAPLTHTDTFLRVGKWLRLVRRWTFGVIGPRQIGPFDAKLKLYESEKQWIARYAARLVEFRPFLQSPAEAVRFAKLHDGTSAEQRIRQRNARRTGLLTRRAFIRGFGTTRLVVHAAVAEALALSLGTNSMNNVNDGRVDSVKLDLNRVELTPAVIRLLFTAHPVRTLLGLIRAGWAHWRLHTRHNILYTPRPSDREPYETRFAVLRAV